jgi:hypothetical protein
VEGIKASALLGTCGHKSDGGAVKNGRRHDDGLGQRGLGISDAVGFGARCASVGWAARPRAGFKEWWAGLARFPRAS